MSLLPLSFPANDGCCRFRISTPEGFEKGMKDIISARLLMLYRATCKVRRGVAL